MSSTMQSQSGNGRTGLLRASIIAAGVSAIGNAIVFFLATGLLNVALRIPPQPGAAELMPLALWQVVVVSAIPAFVAAGLLAVLNRFTSRPVRIFQIIAVVFLLISFVPVLALPVDVTAQVTLALMHIVAAAVIVGFLMNQS